MAILPLRALADSPTESLKRAFLDEVAGALDDGSDRNLLCRRVLCALLYPEFADSWDTAVEDERLAPATRLALAALDPRNITLEPEYYAECDDEKFAGT